MTYEYICVACQHEWEAEQSISAKPLTECPACHQSSAKRMVSGGAGFILKGGGWYADGYGLKAGSSKSENGKGSSGKDSSASSTSSSDSSEKKETKKAGETSSSGSDSTGKTAST